MFSLILFLLIGRTPTIVSEQHDIIEINDVYTVTDEGYVPSITQIIWWDYDHISNRHEIVDWRLVQVDEKPTFKDLVSQRNLVLTDISQKSGINPPRMLEIFANSGLTTPKERLSLIKVLKVRSEEVVFGPRGPQIETTRTPIFSATQKKMYVDTFWDKKSGVIRRISAPVYIRTARQFDIEMEERRHLGQEQRTGLRKPLK